MNRTEILLADPAKWSVLIEELIKKKGPERHCSNPGRRYLRFLILQAICRDVLTPSVSVRDYWDHHKTQNDYVNFCNHYFGRIIKAPEVGNECRVLSADETERLYVAVFGESMKTPQFKPVRRVATHQRALQLTVVA